MTEIDFQCGEFRVYKVNVEGVAFGFIDTGSGGYSPALGETFQYDGTTVVLRDGREFGDITQLRKAIEAGWCVLASDEVTRYRPKAAGIQVRPTETKPNERPTRVSIETTHQEDREIVSVEDRKRRRESTNQHAARRVPLESDEGKAAMQGLGDPALDEIIAAIDGEVGGYVARQRQIEEEARAHEEAKAEAHADILEMFQAVERDEEVPRQVARATPSARNLPVDVQEDRVEMPIVKEDATEAGTVVGQVSGTVVEREDGIQLNIAPATPQVESPKPPPRMGGAGAIVVDEQRHVSDISLSGGAAPIRMDESAKVVSGNTESIRMDQDAQVGTRKKAHAVETGQGQEGVAVSRVLSPTRTTFEATDANTSSSAIQRAQDGKRLAVERLETDDVVVGSVGAEKPGEPGVVATGDVQEATAGDELTDVLPDAATTPTPEVHRRPEEDPAYAAVKMMIPDFEWDKDRKVSERVAAALKHIENPMYVKGILAVETAVGREEIKKALAEELDKRQKAKKKAKGKG